MPVAILHRASRLARVAILLIVVAPATGASDAHFLDEQRGVTQLFQLADERLALMPGVAAYKWQRQAPIADPEREQRVWAEAQRLAAPLGLSADGVQRWFELQVRLAREEQTRLHEHWKAQGFDFAGPIPDLATQVRPQLDRLTKEQILALHLAVPISESAGGGSGVNREELLAALRSIRRETVPVLERIAASGVVRIGTTGDYAPFTFDANGTLSGSDIEMAVQLARALNAQPVFVRTTWSTLLADLDAGRFDLAIGGISVTDERKVQASFSRPYVSGGKTMIARCEDRRRYSSLAKVDRPDVRIIVNPGGTNEQYVRANVHAAQVRVYADNRTIFDEIRMKRADVMITDDTEVELQTHRHKDLCRTMRGTLTHADKAILMPRDAAWLAAVDAWLNKEIARGEPARLLNLHLAR